MQKIPSSSHQFQPNKDLIQAQQHQQHYFRDKQSSKSGFPTDLIIALMIDLHDEIY